MMLGVTSSEPMPMSAHSLIIGQYLINPLLNHLVVLQGSSELRCLLLPVRLIVPLDFA